MDVLGDGLDLVRYVVMLEKAREQTARAESIRFEGDEILNVVALGQFEADDYVMCAASDGHALAVRCDEVSLLSGPGQGVMVMKLEEGVELLGAELGHHDLDQIIVVTDGGKERKLTLQSIIGSRAGKGHAVIRRGGFKEYLWRPAETPSLGGEES